MKKLILVALVLLFAIPAYGAEYTCGTDGVDDSCTPAGLISAISSASDGDTINIAKATHTWSSAVTINKKVTIIGGGSCPDCGSADPTGTMNFPTRLNISGNPAFHINATSGTLVRISGLHIDGVAESFAYQNGWMGAIINVATANQATFRVDNMYFSQNAQNRITFTTNNVMTGTYGVIDHVYHYNEGSGNFPRFIQNTEYGGNLGNTAWSQATTWGSANFVYIEDCTIIFPNPNSQQPALFNDQQGGGRLAARHNYIQNANFGNHGTESGWPARSGVALEFYENEFVWTGGDKLYTAMMWRGGSAYVYSNTFTNFQSMSKFTLFRAGGAPGNSPPAGTDPYDGPGPPTGYPLIDQHGRGQAAGVGLDNTQPQAANKAYFWNNSVPNTGGGGGCGNIGDYNEISMCDPTYIVEGTEYEYSSDSSARDVGYTAYTYPHPLTSGETPVQVDSEPDINSLQVSNGGVVATSFPSGITSITFTAICEDAGTGGSTIDAAEYFISAEGTAGAGTPMNASDGTFDEITEPVTVSINTSAWTSTASPYSLYADCLDATVSTWGPVTAGSTSITLYGTTPTITSVWVNGTSTPTITQGDFTANVTVGCHDNGTGEDPIMAVDFFVGTAGTPGYGTPMTAADGVFNEADEIGVYDVNTSAWIATDSPYIIWGECMDATNTWSVFASVSVAVTTSTDVTAPQPTTAMTAQAGDSRVDLGWINPQDVDWAGTMLRWSNTSAPATTSDGILIYNGPNSTYSHQGLSNGLTYYYSTFPYDEVPNYATATTVSALPQAPVVNPPESGRVIGQ